MNNARKWCIQHPIADGVFSGLVFFIASTLFISVAFPALAISIPITERVVIDLGNLPAWLDRLPAWGGLIVAFAVYWEARKAKQHAVEAVALGTANATKLDIVKKQTDGVLEKVAAMSKQAGNAEGELKGIAAGEETARTLAEGQRQGAESERASAAAANVHQAPALGAKGSSEIPVTDNRVGEATEKIAAATEREAKAKERIADVAEDKKNDGGGPRRCFT